MSTSDSRVRDPQDTPAKISSSDGTTKAEVVSGDAVVSIPSKGLSELVIKSFGSNVTGEFTAPPKITMECTGSEFEVRTEIPKPGNLTLKSSGSDADVEVSIENVGEDYGVIRLIGNSSDLRVVFYVPKNYGVEVREARIVSSDVDIEVDKELRKEGIPTKVIIEIEAISSTIDITVKGGK